MRLACIPALPKLVNDAPACHVQKPRLERADLAVILEVGHVLGDREHGLLHDILRFGLGQTALDSDAINELPISIEEILPARLVLPIFEAQDQSRPCRYQLVFVSRS